MTNFLVSIRDSEGYLLQVLMQRDSSIKDCVDLLLKHSSNKHVYIYKNYHLKTKIGLLYDLGVLNYQDLKLAKINFAYK